MKSSYKISKPLKFHNYAKKNPRSSNCGSLEVGMKFILTSRGKNQNTVKLRSKQNQFQQCRRLMIDIWNTLESYWIPRALEVILLWLYYPHHAQTVS